MATVWEAMVCRMHDADYWKLCKGRNTYVRLSDRREQGLIRSAGFVAFDQYKKLLADSEGKLSGPRTVLAGFGAGFTESLLAVTPTESIKTTLSATLSSHSVVLDA